MNEEKNETGRGRFGKSFTEIARIEAERRDRDLFTRGLGRYGACTEGEPAEPEPIHFIVLENPDEVKFALSDKELGDMMEEAGIQLLTEGNVFLHGALNKGWRILTAPELREAADWLEKMQDVAENFRAACGVTEETWSNLSRESLETFLHGERKRWLEALPPPPPSYSWQMIAPSYALQGLGMENATLDDGEEELVYSEVTEPVSTGVSEIEGLALAHDYDVAVGGALLCDHCRLHCKQALVKGPNGPLICVACFKAGKR